MTVPEGAAVGDTERTFSVVEERGPSFGRTALSWVLTVVIAVTATVAVRTFVFQQYSIPSTSMVPTLEVGDRVIVSKLNKTPGRGDVVVFDRPPNNPVLDDSQPEVLIKRVIGLPGETVDAVDGEVTIDGNRLDEDYLGPGTVTTMDEPIAVGDNEVLVMGDNRSVSLDGRTFGPISQDLIVGRSVLRVWPFSRFGGL